MDSITFPKKPGSINPIGGWANGFLKFEESLFGYFPLLMEKQRMSGSGLEFWNKPKDIKDKVWSKRISS